MCLTNLHLTPSETFSSGGRQGGKPNLCVLPPHVSNCYLRRLFFLGLTFQSHCSLYPHPNPNTFWITDELQSHLLNFSRFPNSIRRSYNRSFPHFSVIVKPKWSYCLMSLRSERNQPLPSLMGTDQCSFYSTLYLSLKCLWHVLS